MFGWEDGKMEQQKNKEERKKNFVFPMSFWYEG